VAWNIQIEVLVLKARLSNPLHQLYIDHASIQRTMNLGAQLTHMISMKPLGWFVAYVEVDYQVLVSLIVGFQ
jgi:hypothetical protein